DHAEDVLGILETIKRGGHVEHYETVRMRKDGTRVEVSLSVSPIRDAGGRIVGASKIARDITARKAADAIIERNLHLRDEFISLASHELKTPLTTVKLQNEIVRRRLAKDDPALLKPEALRKLVTDSDRQVQRLTRLVDEMLDVSRISTG